MMSAKCLSKEISILFSVRAASIISSSDDPRFFYSINIFDIITSFADKLDKDGRDIFIG